MDLWNGTQDGEDQGQDMGANEMDKDAREDNFGMFLLLPLCVLTFFARTGDQCTGC